MAKTMITLVAGKEEKEFEMPHAERILDLQRKRRITTGWQLKPNSGYEYINGTISASNKGTAEKSAKQSGDTGSGKP